MKCLFCKDTKILQHISGNKECYCESVKKASHIVDKVRESNQRIILESEAYGSDCRSGSRE